MLINTYRILNNFISGIDKQNAKKEQETRLFKTANDTLKKIKPIENKKADIDEFYKEILPKLSNEDAVKFSLAALNKLKKKEEYKYKILITRPTTSSREDGNRSKIKTSPDRNIAFLHYWKYLLRAPAGNKIFYKKDIKIDDLKPNELDWYHSLLLEANDSDYKSLREGEKDTDASIKYIDYLRNNPNPRTAELEKYLNTPLTAKMKKDAARRIFDRYLEDKKLVSSYLNKDKNNKISTLINLKIFNDQERAFLDARVKFIGDKNYVYKLTAKDESAKYDKESEKDEVRDNYYLQLDKFRLAAESDIRQGNFKSAIKKYERIVSAGANPNVEYAFLYAKCYERSDKKDNDAASFAKNHREYFYKAIEQKLNHGEKTKLAWAAKAMLDADRDIDSFDAKIAKLNLAQENRTVYLKMQESKIDVLLELGRHNAVLKAVNLIENNYPDLSPDELVALKKKSILSYQKEKKHYEAQVIAKELLAKNISVENRTDLEFILVDSAITARLTKDKVVGQSKEIEAAVGLLKEPDNRALATDKIKYYKAVFYNYIYRKKIKGENFTAKEIDEINRFILDGQKNIKNIDQREFGWLIKDFNLKAAELNYLIAQDFDNIDQRKTYLQTAADFSEKAMSVNEKDITEDVVSLNRRIMASKNGYDKFFFDIAASLEKRTEVLTTSTETTVNHSEFGTEVLNENKTEKINLNIYSVDGNAIYKYNNWLDLGFSSRLSFVSGKKSYFRDNADKLVYIPIFDTMDREEVPDDSDSENIFKFNSANMFFKPVANFQNPIRSFPWLNEISVSPKVGYEYNYYYHNAEYMKEGFDGYPIHSFQGGIDFAAAFSPKNMKDIFSVDTFFKYNYKHSSKAKKIDQQYGDTYLDPEEGMVTEEDTFSEKNIKNQGAQYISYGLNVNLAGSNLYSSLGVQSNIFSKTWYSPMYEYADGETKTYNDFLMNFTLGARFDTSIGDFDINGKISNDVSSFFSAPRRWEANLLYAPSDNWAFRFSLYGEKAFKRTSPVKTARNVKEEDGAIIESISNTKSSYEGKTEMGGKFEFLKRINFTN